MSVLSRQSTLPPFPAPHLWKTCAGLGITIENDNLITEDKQRFIDLLDNNSDRFATCLLDLDKEPTPLITHHIDTQCHAPIRLLPPPESPTARIATKKKIDELLEAGLVRPSQSPWSAPLLLAKKKLLALLIHLTPPLSLVTDLFWIIGLLIKS